MKSITVNTLDSKAIKIQAHWIGENLAVHREIIIREDCGGIVGPNPNKNAVFAWTVTHLNTGLQAGKFNSRSSAISAAKSADSLFAGIKTEDDATSNDYLRIIWGNTVRKFYGFVT
jgi:hypothetical protein